jgi:hypothetical protein
MEMLRFYEPAKHAKIHENKHRKKLRGAFLFAVMLGFCFSHLTAEETLRFKGDYFLYSDDHNYIYGGGNIVMTAGGRRVQGSVLYMDVARLTGVIYGNVRVSAKGKKKGDKKKKKEKKDKIKKQEKIYDAVFFKGVPPKWLMVSFKEEIITEGDQTLKADFVKFVKKKPETLKDSAMYYECNEFRINKNQKIKAKIVVPYMMGLPTVPLKRFTVRRGEWEEKTMLAFNNVNYTGVDGLSLLFFLRLKEKWIKGDYDIKLYERELFKMDGVKRGVLFSGQSSVTAKNKEIFNYNVLLNSGEKTFNLHLNHRRNFKHFKYSFSQNISGREKQDTFFEFASDVTIKKLTIFAPTFTFTHDLKKSWSYGVSTPLNIWKKLNMNVCWQRKNINETYRSDTSNLTASLGFTSSLFSLSSNYNFSKNLLEATVKKNFSVNMRLKPLQFLEKNVSVDISSTYMFSSLPYGDQTQSRVSPAVNIAVSSAGVSMPLGLELVPAFTFNHLWDNREANFTDFQYALALRKRIGKFSTTLAYSLASRYRAENFWIEGNSQQNMNLDLELKNKKDYAFLLRFYYNNQLALETISFTGKLSLPFDLSFSSFMLYYEKEKKFQTLEVFIEKIFKNKIRIQGGYSLALKRFFVKFLTM